MLTSHFCAVFTQNNTLHFFDDVLLCFLIKKRSYCIGCAADLFEKIQRLCISGSAKPRNAILSGQRREVVCYEVKLRVNLANQIFCHLRYTPLRLVDDLLLT